MKRKGFTLAELLAVIVVLGLVAVITIPAVTKALGEYKVRLCNEQVANIEEAARVWGSDNFFSLPDTNGEVLNPALTLKVLQDGGYIKEEIKNPINSTEIPETTTITVKRENKKVTYKVNYSCES